MPIFAVHDHNVICAALTNNKMIDGVAIEYLLLQAANTLYLYIKLRRSRDCFFPSSFKFIGHATRNDIVDDSLMAFNVAKIASSVRTVTKSSTISLRVAGCLVCLVTRLRYYTMPHCQDNESVHRKEQLATRINMIP